jgi:hypothetical protein
MMFWVKGIVSYCTEDGQGVVLRAKAATNAIGLSGSRAFSVGYAAVEAVFDEVLMPEMANTSAVHAGES